MRDPFEGAGDERTGTGDNLVWWQPGKPGYRLVGQLEGVFKGKKVEFAKFTEAVIYRMADHKPIQFFPVVAMLTMDAKVRKEDAGSMVIVTATGQTEGKKAGIWFLTYSTRVMVTKEENVKVKTLNERAEKKLAEEVQTAPLPLDDNDGLPF